MKRPTWLVCLCLVTALLCSVATIPEGLGGVAFTRGSPKAAASLSIAIGGMVPSGGSQPLPRSNFGLAFSQRAGGLVLFGGMFQGFRLNDTWLLKNGSWSELKTSHSPPPLYYFSMAPLVENGSVILFGGGGNVGGCVFCNATWVFNGTDWANLSGIHEPPPRVGAGLTYDPNRHALILFGGWNGTNFLNDTWEFVKGSWLPVRTSISPGARMPSLFAESSAGNVIEFGGEGCPSQPAPSCNNSDAGFLGDTWMLSPSGWSKLAPATELSPTAGGAGAFDPENGLDVMVGGETSDATPPLSEVWEYYGSDWENVSNSTALPARSFGAMAADPEVGGLVLFGGRGVASYLNDTWIYNNSQWNLLGAHSQSAAGPTPWTIVIPAGGGGIVGLSLIALYVRRVRSRVRGSMIQPPPDSGDRTGLPKRDEFDPR